MIIPVEINGKSIQLEADPDTKLLSVLRRMGFTGAKCGCQKGFCGACTILVNGIPVPSCLLPAASVRNTKIITLEHFMSTSFYAAIEVGFAVTGVHLCGICNPGKIFAAYQLINSHDRIERPLVYQAIAQLACYCTDTDSLVDGIMYAADFLREHGAGGLLL